MFSYQLSLWLVWPKATKHCHWSIILLVFKAEEQAPDLFREEAQALDLTLRHVFPSVTSRESLVAKVEAAKPASQWHLGDGWKCFGTCKRIKGQVGSRVFGSCHHRPL